MTSAFHFDSVFPLGIVVAMEREARTLTKADLKKNKPMQFREGSWFWISGMGRVRAEHAAQSLFKGGCRILASWGTVGALDPYLKPGTLFLPHKIYSEEGETYVTDKVLRDRLNRLCAPEVKVMGGDLLTVDRIVTAVSEKQDLKDRYAVAAIDMEASAVARVAANCNIPFLAIKAPVDLPDQHLPIWVTRSLDPWGNLVKKAILKNISGIKPGDCTQLRHLSRNYHSAQNVLLNVSQKMDYLPFQNI